MAGSGHYKDLIYDHYEGLHVTDKDEKFNLRPLFSIDHKDENTLLEWLQETLLCLGDENASRAENQFTNIQFYEGIHTLKEAGPSVQAQDGQARPISLENRFVMNHILDFTVQKHSRFLRYSPNLNVLPWNNEYKDKLGARISKKTIDHNFYSLDVDGHLSDLVMNAILCGEGYMFVEWDKYKGDLDQEVKRAQELKERQIISSFQNTNGQEINLEQIKRIGDHTCTVPLPCHVLTEPRIKWPDVNYAFKATLKHIDELKAENPGVNFSNVNVPTPSKTNKSDYGMSAHRGEWHIQWEFYHKHHRFLPKGKYVRFVDGILLEAKDLPYTHGMLPIVRFTDYDSVVSSHGWSFYESLKLPSVMINNMMKVAYRSFCIAAYPKLIAAENSFNFYSMANGPFVIEYTPGVGNPPELVTFNGVQQEFFQLSDHVERFMEKNSGTFGVSRGEAMPNARARSILNFYEEQEEKRESSQIRKYSAAIEKLGKMILTNSGQYYKPDDQRTLKIVGKNNSYKVRVLDDVTKLTGPYVVKVERTTALSESKQGKIDQIATLSSVPLSDPQSPGGTTGLFTREQILQMVEVADVDTFFEMATAAAERANSENEDLFENYPVEAPSEWQAHLIDWNVHFQFMQSREFSDTRGLPQEIREKFIRHLMAHEMFLWQKAQTNMKLCQLLTENQYFPAVFVPPPGSWPLIQVLMMLQQPPMPPEMMGGAPNMEPAPGDGTDMPVDELPPEEQVVSEDVSEQEMQEPQGVPTA